MEMMMMMRMQARRTRTENVHDPLAQTRAAPGSCDHEYAAHFEPRCFLAHPRQRAGREYDTLRWEIMDEGGRHGDRANDEWQITNGAWRMGLVTLLPLLATRHSLFAMRLFSATTAREDADAIYLETRGRRGSGHRDRV